MLNMNTVAINPLVRLQTQLRENTESGLIPPQREHMTDLEAARDLHLALEQSKMLGIITDAERDDLEMQGLFEDAPKLIQAKTFVFIINALVQGVDMRLEDANHFIKLLCAENVSSAGLVMKVMLEDLGSVDRRLAELFRDGHISEEDYQKIADRFIGFDRLKAFLDSGTKVEKA
jgi:hypothetical protein